MLMEIQLLLKRVKPLATGIIWTGVVLLTVACDSKTQPQPGKPTTLPKPAVDFSTFVEVSDSSGIQFEATNGFDGQNWRVVETITGGVAVEDFNGDGHLDIYFTNGQPLDAKKKSSNAFYLGNGDGTFRDFTLESGLLSHAYSLGCCVADIDGDGDPDLYVTNDGTNMLYLNDGRGVFSAKIPHESGIQAMSTGCAFLDYDRDGDLDLYVASYTHEKKNSYPPAKLRGIPSYWPPANYPGQADYLFENQGNGQFVDRSEDSGIRELSPERGLGVIASDIDGDGNIDLFVANDMGPNFMFFGDGKGKFSEEGFLNGTALSDTGDVLGSMGVGIADYDGDGKMDLAVTNYQGQTNNLYRNLGGREFVEQGLVSKLFSSSLQDVAWGMVWADFDNDGFKDFYTANGHLNPYARQLNDGTRYKQADRLFKNLGGGKFKDVSTQIAHLKPQVSRGLAVGDFDSDGDLDLVITRSNGKPRILKNEAPKNHKWLAVRLVGDRQNKSAIGAKVELKVGNQVQLQERRSSASYLSSHSGFLHFGLGSQTQAVNIRVQWLDGTEQTQTVPALNQILTITKKAP